MHIESFGCSTQLIQRFKVEFTLDSPKMLSQVIIIQTSPDIPHNSKQQTIPVQVQNGRTTTNEPTNQPRQKCEKTKLPLSLAKVGASCLRSSYDKNLSLGVFWRPKNGRHFFPRKFSTSEATIILEKGDILVFREGDLTYK